MDGSVRVAQLVHAELQIADRSSHLHTWKHVTEPSEAGWTLVSSPDRFSSPRRKMRRKYGLGTLGTIFWALRRQMGIIWK